MRVIAPERLTPEPPNMPQAPVCRTQHDSRIFDNIEAFRKFYRDLVKHDLKEMFRVKQGASTADCPLNGIVSKRRLALKANCKARSDLGR